MDRQADHKVIKATKHFITVSNADSNDYGVNGFNPGQMYITFNNSGVTNIQSFNDSTTTNMRPISFSADVFYNNVAQSFRNNRFRLSSITDDASPALRVGGVSEATAPITITVPDYIYKTGTELATALQTALNAKLVAWIGGNVISNFTVVFGAATNTFTLGYTVAAPAGIAALNPIVVLTTSFVDTDTLAYDSSRIWGTTGSTIGGIYVSGTFQLPYANRVAGVALPSFVDLNTVQVFRVHSNISKRFFAKIGAAGASAPQRPLSLTDILFEIPYDGVLGATLNHEFADDRYYQEVASNLDELRLTITDNKNNVVTFTNNAEINFTFSIDRQIIVPDNEERIKALADYNRFRSY
jgi:hypothetical protein